MSVEFELEGADDLAKSIKELLAGYPTESRAELEKVADDFKKDVNKKFPNGGTTGGRKSVAKKWKKTKMEGPFTGMTVGVELRNTAPVFHLVENGHELYMSPEMYAAYKTGKLGHIKRGTKNGKSGTRNLVHAGYVKGKHYCEKTRNEWNNGEFEARMQKHVDKILKKNGL